MKTWEALCPAKVNLGLRILGARPDGYHELDTVFQAIDLHDSLTLRATGDLHLRCDTPAVPTGEDNLVLRAARLVARRCGIEQPQGRFELRKTIPMGGGLGGGSSDAAAALRLCVAAWGLQLESRTLDELGGELGADVPFFLHGGTARGRGRGDRIEPQPFAGARDLVLGTPPFGLSTAEVFARHRARLTGSANGVSLPVRLAYKSQSDNDFGLTSNDLEAVVFAGWPELERFRDALLESGSGGAMLSGSGSTVFGVFRGVRRARAAAVSLRKRFGSWQILATRAVRWGVRVRVVG